MRRFQSLIAWSQCPLRGHCPQMRSVPLSAPVVLGHHGGSVPSRPCRNPTSPALASRWSSPTGLAPWNQTPSWTCHASSDRRTCAKRRTGALSVARRNVPPSLTSQCRCQLYQALLPTAGLQSVGGKFPRGSISSYFASSKDEKAMRGKQAAPGLLRFLSRCGLVEETGSHSWLS